MSRITNPANRREAVEQASRAFTHIPALKALCDELGKVDDLDRMVAQAQERMSAAAAAEEKAADAHTKARKEARERAAKADAAAQAKIAGMLAKAEELFIDAEARAQGVAKAAGDAAAQVMAEATASAEKIAAECAAAQAWLADINQQIACRTAEAEDVEARIIKARASAAALLGG